VFAELLLRHYEAVVGARREGGSNCGRCGQLFRRLEGGK
jgi:hypothetical protein